MATVSVDVDLEDFDTDDIIGELKYRLGKLSKREKELMDELVEKYGKQAVIKPVSKVDEWKVQVFSENHHKFTLEEIEGFFTSK